MGLTEFEKAKIKISVERFLERVRPDESIRSKLDIVYRLENHSVIISERRPNWMNPKEYIDMDNAKLVYVKAEKIWKLYWMRADLKWHLFNPTTMFDDLNKALDVVAEDETGAFWG